MKKALIVMAEGAEEMESISVIDVLRRGGVKVEIAALNGNADTSVHCAHGTVIVADTILDKASHDYDAVIIPGGLKGATNCRNSTLLGEYLQKQHHDGKLVAAICAAPGFVLTKHGILTSEIPAAGYPGTEQEIPNYKTDGVVCALEHGVITGRGPAYAVKFGLAILKALTDEETTNKTVAGMLLNE